MKRSPMKGYRLKPGRPGQRAVLSLLVAAMLGSWIDCGRTMALEVSTDRPDFTNSTATVPPGLVQIETGLVSSLQSEVILDETTGRTFRAKSRQLAIEATVRWGILPWAELRLDGQPFIRERSSKGEASSGQGDLAVSGKFRFLDEQDQHWWPSLGLTPFVKIPTASSTKRLGTGLADFGAILLMSKDFPWDLHADLNIGLAGIGVAGDPGGMIFRNTVSLSIGRPLPLKGLATFWEIFYSSREAPEARHILGTDFGFVYTIHPRVALDTSLEVGLGGDANDYAIRGGITVLLGPLRDSLDKP